MKSVVGPLRWIALIVFALGLVLHAAADPITLRFAIWDGDEALKVLRSEAHKFEEAHPGVTVHLENTDYKIYFQKLLTQYAARTAPDVAMLDPQNYQQFAKRGALLKLDPMIAETPGFDLSAYYKEIVVAMQWRKELYVLPRDIAPIGLIYYNKELFKEAGLDLPDGSWTWDYKPRPELGSKCFTYCMQKLTKFKADGSVERWGFAPSWQGAITDTFAYSTGSRYCNDPPEAFTRMTMDDPNVIKTFDFVANLANKEHWMPSTSELTSVAQSTAVDLFISRRAAMYQCGIWDVAHIRAAVKPGTKEFFDWDITLAPGHIDPKTGKVIKAWPTGGSGYGIMSSTEHPKEAWELVQWMGGPHAMKALAQAGIGQPAIHSLAIGPDWIPGPNTPIEQRYPASRIVTDQAIPYVVFPATADYWSEVSSLAFAKAEPVYAGTRLAKDALVDGNNMANARLNAMLHKQKLPDYNWKSGTALGILIVGALCLWIWYPELKKKHTAGQKRETRIGYLFLTPWIIGTLTLTLGPMILSLLMSFADWDIIMPAKWAGLGNYREAFFEDPRFWNSFKITILYTAISVPAGIIIALALALLLNQKIKGMPIFRTFFYIPTLVSLVATSLLWMKIFQPTGGLLNTLMFGAKGTGGLGHYIGVNGQAPNWLGDERLSLSAMMIMSLWGVGGAMVILLAGLQGVPDVYYEAATLDGASMWRRFKAVTVPLLSPALFFTMVTGMIGAVQVFIQPFVMTQGGPNNSTRFLMVHIYDEGFANLRMGYASSLAWILFVVILGVTIAQFRLNKLVHYEGDVR